MIRLARSIGFACPFVAAVVLGFACTTTELTSEPPVVDAATDATPASDVVVGSSDARQSGRALVLQANTPVEGARVSVAGKDTLTDAEGRYTLVVPRGKPVTMRLNLVDYYQLIEQEYVIDKDPYDRGDSLMLSKQTANLLAAFLEGVDKTKGLLAVRVIPMKGCASEGGTVLTLDPPGATVRYTQNGLPGTGTSLAAGENNGALFYNVTPGVPVKVAAQNPKCDLLPFPVSYQGVTYTGAQTTEPGDSFSFVRVFLGPRLLVDGGSADAMAEGGSEGGADATPPTDGGAD